MANVEINQLPSGTLDSETSMLATDNLVNGAYGSYSTTPKDIVDSCITKLQATLEAGETSLLFQDPHIKDGSCIEYFTVPRGVYPTNEQAVPGVLNLTFPELSYDLVVTVRIIG